MDASDVCPTEDAIQAFLDQLVDPQLPAKPSMRNTPSLDQQESVAKQLVVDLKPALLAHMKFMKRSSDTELDDLEKQLSVTERAIMDACDLSTSLDASRGAPNTEGWPISKIAVLLVDSKNEKCFLLDGTSSNSITQGVWSIIDKSLEVRDHSSDDTRELKHVNKKQRFIGKPSRGELRTDETSCQNLAYSAITEATDISQNDLLFLESHVVYSDSRKKAAALFFIVQCTKSGIRKIEFPIKEVIDRLQGPLVTKDSSGWTVTTVVEYFHLLPYAEILSDWFHRRELSNGSQDSLGPGDVIMPSPNRTERPCRPESCKIQEKNHVSDVVIEDPGRNTSSGSPSFKQKDSTGGCKIDLAHAFNGSQEMELENSSMVALKKNKRSTKVSSPIQFVSHQDDTHSCIKNEITKTKDKLSHVKHTTTKDLGNNTSSSKPQLYKNEDTTVYKNTRQAEALNGPQNVLMDDSSMVPSQNVESCKKSSSSVQVVNQRKNISLIGTELNGSVTNNKVETVKPTSPSITDCRVTIVGGNGTCDINSSSQESKGGHTFSTCQSNLKDSDKLQNAIASKKHILLQTALNVLMNKRNELSLKKRNVEDELARCEKDIQTIINDSEDGSAVIIDSIIEGCNDGYKRNRRTHALLEEEFSSKSIKRKKLSEAILDEQDPRLALDDICLKNGWVLPIYHVSPSDGKYQADVTVEGLDFNCTSDVHLCSSPREAKESSAFQMLVKLRSMAVQAKSR
ncbi:uncharacterized protein LOC126790794 isoform X2 [Argentina anserina]|uniref:uncharacterized protein LOC126790794 isoform X2 n=1 Tax=Argentina anserina TaxID=57926 RepID=UPI002176832E|nr:uncharacterized protein LOC126790794 isoform X2 [Potentilla anserina]